MDHLFINKFGFLNKYQTGVLLVGGSEDLDKHR